MPTCMHRCTCTISQAVLTLQLQLLKINEETVSVDFNKEKIGNACSLILSCNYMWTSDWRLYSIVHILRIWKYSQKMDPLIFHTNLHYFCNLYQTKFGSRNITCCFHNWIWIYKQVAIHMVAWINSKVQ